jgi:UDP-N-acetylmuramyl pentapeptide phosphotransferase/UDP-N-acetylglucosamine-1-phosphate transferase
MCILLIALELSYFKIAEYFEIVDKPNHRSSHTNITLRGGGIIFSLAFLVYPFFFPLHCSYFIVGLLLIASVSFIDDINPVSSKLRIFVHLIAVLFMLYQLRLFSMPLYFIPLALFIVIGSINAINFMDGINGITGLYSFIALCTLLYINLLVVNFIDSSLIFTAILSVTIFNFFNFRKKAKCFAGDVGSVGMAFIILFFLLTLVIKTEEYSYFLILLVYGMDTFTTIFFRMIRRERLSEAHRLHFYQYLANDKKIPHLLVASIYALSQTIINIVVIKILPSSFFIFFLLLLSCTAVFITIRFSLEGSTKLLGRKDND